jgi:hypothetical protein
MADANSQGAPKPDMSKARSKPTRAPKPSTKPAKSGNASGSEVSTGGKPRVS